MITVILNDLSRILALTAGWLKPPGLIYTAWCIGYARDLTVSGSRYSSHVVNNSSGTTTPWMIISGKIPKVNTMAIPMLTLHLSMLTGIVTLNNC